MKALLMKCFLLTEIILIGVCTLSGCAFKESIYKTSSPTSTQEAPTPSNTAPKESSVVKATAIVKKRGFISISGSKEKGMPFGEYKREYEVNESETAINIVSPVTLPERVPSEFTLKVSSTAWKDKSLGKVIARSRLTLDNGVATELAVTDISTVSDAENQAVAWTMNIGGLDKLMSSTEEGMQFLQVELYEKGKGDATEVLTFAVVTPPSKLTAKQVTAASYESTKGSTAVADLKTILSTNFRLDLIQVVQLKNNSTLPVLIREPIKLNGHLNSHYRRTQVNQRRCDYDAPSDGWVDELATDFFMLPLTKEVVEDPVTFINRKLKPSYWELELEPGEEKDIGIYAQGAGVVRLVSGAYPMQKMQPTQVVYHCKSRCSGPNQVYFQGYWSKKGWPGASKQCVDPELCISGNGSWAPRIRDAECNACLEWDLQTNPWNDVREIPGSEFNRVFCLGNAPNRGWIIEKLYTTIQTGIENGDVTLRLSPESTLVRARFDFKDPEEMTQERTIGGLIQEMSIQQK